MAEVRIPFCATSELQPPFMLDETWSEPQGVKSILFDKSQLNVVGQMETVEVPDVGPVRTVIYHVMGAIYYICNAYPVVKSDMRYRLEEQAAGFNDDIGNLASSCVVTETVTPLGWVSGSGCLHVDVSFGGGSSLENMPNIEEVTVDDFAVANNISSGMAPTCLDSCNEEVKYTVKWRGCFVIKLSGLAD